LFSDLIGQQRVWIAVTIPTLEQTRLQRYMSKNAAGKRTGGRDVQIRLVSDIIAT
jgi:hypothetical protein